MGVIKQTKIIYFSLGLMYAPFLFQGVSFLFIVAKYIYFLATTTQTLLFNEYVTFSLFILFLFVISLIIMLAPIILYKHFLEEVTK